MRITNKHTLKLVLLLIIIQLIVIVLLGIHIYQKKKVLGVSISPINKEDIFFNPDENLKNFFELKPNIKIQNQPSWTEDLTDIGTATINSEGLNEKFSYFLNKPPDTYRIIALGDSYTYGWFVNTSENYPEQLEDKLNNYKYDCKNNFEVINLGVGGYDIEFAAHRFETRGAEYNPDLVLWFIKGNDFTEIADLMIPLGSKRFEDIKRQGAQPKYLSQGILSNPGWTEVRSEIQSKIGYDTIVQYQTNKFYNFSKIYSGKLLVFTFNKTLDRYKEIMSEFSKKRPETYFFDGIPNLDKPKFAFPDDHPTPDGYKKIASLIFQHLLDKQLIPCSK